MLPKNSKFIPVTPDAYAKAVGVALVNEIGDSHRALKLVQRWTGACERTATNWLHGDVGPRGHHLVSLAANSPEVLTVLLLMAGRREAVSSVRLFALRDEAERFVRLVDG